MSNLFSHLVNSTVTVLLKTTQHDSSVQYAILAVLLRHLSLFILKLKNASELTRNLISTNSYMKT